MAILLNNGIFFVSVIKFGSRRSLAIKPSCGQLALAVIKYMCEYQFFCTQFPYSQAPHNSSIKVDFV